MVDSFYQQLFIRLHRPYLVRSYRDEQYFQSRINRHFYRPPDRGTPQEAIGREWQIS